MHIILVFIVAVENYHKLNGLKNPSYSLRDLEVRSLNQGDGSTGILLRL